MDYSDSLVRARVALHQYRYFQPDEIIYVNLFEWL